MDTDSGWEIFFRMKSYFKKLIKINDLFFNLKIDFSDE
ncbi:hypothetical protein RV07_GL000808 [Enterococcus malodoratus]|nr:hypothetical protein RV07_GL000808 [Enterococcus malodoratus]